MFDIEEGPKKLPTANDVRRALDRKNTEVAKEMWREIIINDSETAIQMMKVEDLDVVSAGLHATMEIRGNEKLQTDLYLAAMQNPVRETMLMASGMMKRSGMHLGLMREFKTEDDFARKKALARAIGLTQPALPGDVAAFLEANPDPIIAAADIGKLGDLLGKGSISPADLTRIRRSVAAKDYEALRTFHEERIQQQRFALVKEALAKTGKVDEADLNAETTRYMEILKLAEVNAEDLYRDPEISRMRIIARNSKLPDADRMTPDEMKRLAEISVGIQAEPELYYTIANQQIMTALLEFDDKSYYADYAEVSGDPTLTPAMCLEKQMIILREAAISEIGGSGASLKLTVRLFKEGKTAVSHSISEDAKEAVKTTATITTAAVVAGILSAPTEENVEQQKEAQKLLNDVSPEMKNALQSGKAIERNDGSVEVNVEGQAVIFDMEGGKLTAFVEANDGTRFYLERMTVADLEAKTLFGPVQYNLNRTLWSDEQYTDVQLLGDVFGLDVRDEQFDPITKRRMFTEQLKALPNDRKTVIELYQSLGVLGADLRVNRLQALKVSSLYAYLDARMGLEHVSKKDIEAIATVWRQAQQAGQPLELMTPQEANSILENENA